MAAKQHSKSTRAKARQSTDPVHTVTIKGYPADHKFQVIQAVAKYAGMNPTGAKLAIRELPAVIKVPLSTIVDLVHALEAAGVQSDQLKVDDGPAPAGDNAMPPRKVVEAWLDDMSVRACRAHGTFRMVTLAVCDIENNGADDLGSRINDVRNALDAANELLAKLCDELIDHRPIATDELP